ncbi:MAG: NupC/NupG family nucleoside CNT transporter [Acidobacteria bacterium]|nr:NupC/NupG family nucleoside CNT transporter [Acidobacteriota bacterium]
MYRLVSLVGLIFMMLVAFAISENRKKISFRVIIGGLLLQFLFAVLILKTGPGQSAFHAVEMYAAKLLAFSQAGSEFVFGKLASPDSTLKPGFIFAFQVLPTIIFFSSLMAVLYHLHIMQKIIRGMAFVMQKTMRISGAESMAVAANTFVGQTEAPLVIEPYVSNMTMSELMTLMVGGMATIAGSVLVAYVGLGLNAGHLVAASIMSAPAAVLIAKIIYPEMGKPLTLDEHKAEIKVTTTNLIDAAAEGATVGLKLALNVAAMLIAFIALIHMFDAFLGIFHTNLKTVLGTLFYPFAVVMGVPLKDCVSFGYLLGTKISVNEFVAYTELAKMTSAGMLSHRSIVLATYALCGFANFSSIAIQVGGIGAIAPGRKKDLAKLGLKAMIGGALASWMTACVAGLLI